MGGETDNYAMGGTGSTFGDSNRPGGIFPVLLMALPFALIVVHWLFAMSDIDRDIGVATISNADNQKIAIREYGETRVQLYGLDIGIRAAWLAVTYVFNYLYGKYIEDSTAYNGGIEKNRRDERGAVAVALGHTSKGR